MTKRLRYGLFVVLGMVMCLLGSSLSTPLTRTHALQSPVELAQAGSRSSAFVEADQLYRQGDIASAEELYRELKPEFAAGSVSQVIEPIYEAEALDSADLAYWNAAQRSIADNQTSGAIVALEQLIASEPGFIVAPLQLAEILQEEDRGGDALNVLEQAATVHPYSSDIVMAQVNALANDGQHLEASIAARSFAILNLDNPLAGEFRSRAQSELDTFLNNQRNQNIAETGVSIGIGILTGNAPWSSTDAAVDTYERVARIFQDESALGAELAGQIKEDYRQQGKLVEDPEVVDYITQLGLGVAQLMGRDFDYEFFVINEPSINAFALPGGKIFVHTGAILAANSQAELAGLMGHEVAHAVLSHGMQRISKNDILSQLGDQIPYGDIFANLISLEYSRQHERQSDILGTRALAASGYAADGLRNFMATLNANVQSNQPEYLSSHPASASRVQYLEELIQQNGYNRYALEGVDQHEAIRNKLA
ncbi:M48 family metalloprotease [Oscillatoria sp. CS-180]|uniref:M48 family metallopeptidase n=1 Tax=Oscillatoria sp. CS-180 TaxID=3021720 RepID=UPI00232F136F|nr:M48 family metallopeptidase [Oscillatoria sp. CS-180]MDB9525265.1 M48 family metalloprotease [Oscillatoria sp. CS-180]